MSDYSPLMLPFRNFGGGGRRLKIALHIGGVPAPIWIRDLTDYLKGIPHFDVHVVASAGAKRPEPAWLTDRLYNASRRKYDPFAVAQLDAAMEIPAGVDMLVWLDGEAVPDGTCAGFAPAAVFTLQSGSERTYPPYWREVIEGHPSTSTALYWHTAAFGRGRPVRIAQTGTRQDWAFTRNAAEPFAAAARIIASTGIELLSNRAAWMERALRIPEQERPAGVRRSFPSTVDAARFAARQAARSIGVRVHGRGEKERRWFIGIRRDPSLFYAGRGRFSATGIEELPLNALHMADPFVATHQGRDWLFYEEIPQGSSKGRLMCAGIGRQPGMDTKPEAILQASHHLSYPCVFEHGGDYFLMPESSEQRTVELYRATRFPFEFQLERRTLEDVALVDTTPFFLDGTWYFFTTTTEPFMQSFLFWAASLDGRWNLHPASPISSSVHNTRAAGHLFYRNGRLFRPTQDCSVRYGYGMTINEVLRLTPTEFEERAVDFIAPTWRSGLLGTHTLNSNAAIEAIDGIRYQ